MTDPYVLVVKGERPPTMNADRGKKNHWQKAADTEGYRTLGAGLARQARIPNCDQIATRVTPLYRDGRSPQDVGACAPAAKAMVDGLDDAGVILGDGPTRHVEMTFRPGRIVGFNGLQLEVFDLSSSPVTIHHGTHLMVPVSADTLLALAQRCGTRDTDRLADHAAALLAHHLDPTRKGTP